MPLTPGGILKWIRHLTFCLPGARRRVETELETLTAEDPDVGLCVRNQVEEDWGTMDADEAFWIAHFAWGYWDELNLDGGLDKYPELKSFFKTFIIRALLVFCYQRPRAIIALTLLFNDIPLARYEHEHEHEHDDFEERWPIMVAQRRALLRWRHNHADASRLETGTGMAGFTL
ncbi:hypothetical protein FA13DRAFT_1711847 [Coprinellus micaceus]|uniref:Uncharacterized protein n=1 Tax=Coprinellus micaceus TaxID=71717 RepID=A0A4Y7T319_COPMI|nr:hypothetical protein FA13DRAFT_1711847 [Coprinellus micaceus]